MEKETFDGIRANGVLEHLDYDICRIKDCSSEVELDALLRALLLRLDIESYLFVILHGAQANCEHFRCLVGCSPKWCQLYTAKRWFAIDPLIQYALRDSRPIPLSAITPETSGQSEMLRIAAAYGFRSGMVIPAHGVNKSAVGVLYLGSKQPPEIVEPEFRHARNLMRAIALELLEWWEARIHEEALAHYQLDKIDVQLLELEAEGFTAAEAGRLLGCSTSLVNGRFRRMNDKFDVHYKKYAVERARELGILRA